jgi:hypothetical protein
MLEAIETTRYFHPSINPPPHAAMQSTNNFQPQFIGHQLKIWLKKSI